MGDQQIQYIRQIENACVGLQSPDEKVRSSAEAFVVAYNAMQSPYQLCFALLEVSQSTWAHFYTMSTIRDAALREWAPLDATLKRHIVEKLLEYVLAAGRLSYIDSAARRQAYNTLAVLCKRAWNDELSPTTLVLDRMYSMFEARQPEQLTTAVGVCLAFVTEFASTSRAANMQLTWDFHQKAMVAFQSQHLQPIFRHALEVLGMFRGQTVDTRLAPLLNSTLALVSDVLDWRFSDSDSTALAFLASFSTTHYQLRPPAEWAPLFAQSNAILDIVFGLYPLVQSHREMSHLLRISMTRLACLSGPIVKTATARNGYLTALITHLLPLLQHAITSQNWSELEDLANLLYRLCGNFKFEALVVLPLDVSRTFIEHLGRFIMSSLTFMKVTIQMGDFANEFENECFALLIRAWVALLSDAEMMMTRRKSDMLENFTELFGVVQTGTQHIYQSYVQTRLELAMAELQNDAAEDELDEDKNKYNEQLKSVSYVGRMAPGSSMELLTKEINSLIDKLMQNGPKDEYVEQLHWLILMAGHLLFDSDNNCLSAIPNQIEAFSYEQHTKNSQSDAVIDLTNAVIRYSIEYENKMLLHHNNTASVSPLTAETATWFLAQWSLVYLKPSTTLNIQLSPRLIAAYSADSSVQQISHVLLSKVVVNLRFWAGELNVLAATCKLFHSLTINTDVPKYLVRANDWADLFYMRGNLSRLPPNVQGRLFEGLTRVVYSLDDADKQPHFDELVKSLVEALESLFRRNDFQSIAQDAEVKESLYSLLERFKGVISVSDTDYTLDSESAKLFLGFDLFIKYAKSFMALIPIYNHCHDIVALILQTRSNIVFPIFVDLFQTISNVSSSMLSKSGQHNIENKEYYARIKMVIRILSNIVLFNDVTNEYPQLIAKTVFHGICIVAPCVTQNGLLQYTKLSNQFFSIIVFVLSSDEINLTQFPPETAATLFGLVEFGVSHHDTDISKNCLDAILAMTKNVQKLRAESINVDISIVTRLIGTMINFLMLVDFNMNELLFTATTTFVELVICNPDGYRTKMMELIHMQDPSLRPVISQHWETLMQGTGDLNDRHAKEDFRKNLQTFMNNVKPLIKRK
eukprot:gene13253-15579_t